MKAFSTLKRLSIIHPEKRDGGLLTCYLNQEGKIVTSHEQVLSSCVEQLLKLSGRNHVREYDISLNDIPTLSPLVNEDITSMQQVINKDKAITGDGFSHGFFKTSKNNRILNNWWRKETIAHLPRDTFEMRLIPLNKVWPKIPKADEFRPIVITSPAYKWMELRFLSKITAYLTNRLDRNQTGFVEGCGTSLNIKMVISELQKVKTRDNKVALFVDLKSAYNTVYREKLFGIMKRKGILTHEESDFLEIIQSMLYFKVCGENVALKNGVIQGSSLSPGLFNIYFEEVIAEVKEEFN